MCNGICCKDKNKKEKFQEKTNKILILSSFFLFLGIKQLSNCFNESCFFSFFYFSPDLYRNSHFCHISKPIFVNCKCKYSEISPFLRIFADNFNIICEMTRQRQLYIQLIPFFHISFPLPACHTACAYRREAQSRLS